MIDFIICVGNGDKSADELAKKIAVDYALTHRGFLDNNTELLPGCYHTSVYDIKLLQLTTKVADIVDRLKIIVLDQPISCYKNSRDFHDTVEMAQALISHCTVEFVNPSMFNSLIESLKENKSFCIAPFVALKDNTRHCCYMKNFDNPYTNFYTDPNSIKMRQQMLAGEKIDLCQRCYSYEEFGAASPRQGLTREWAYRLNLKSYDDVVKNTKLIRYEIFLGNYCNLQCRMCDPSSSSQIDDEYVDLGLSQQRLGIVNQNHLDKVDLDQVQQLHLTGGEPSINQDLYNFLKKCIDLNKKDFEIFINTNGVSLTKEFVSLIKQFKNVRIAISIDGFDRVNQYIRWPTNWGKFKSNVQTLTESIAPQNYHFHTTLSIYNVSQLYQLYEFLDHYHPTVLFNMDVLETPEHLQAWNFPNKEVVLQNLNKIKTLNKYHYDQVFNSKINGIIQRIETCKIDLIMLEKFFRFNDLLDQSRQVRLVDYIPELEQCRSFVKT
jgi:MoaA/NifB/PqqE/SkfB family radical SAM enzyme